jgi:antitoxin Phd
MKTVWTLQDAKSRFSALVAEAEQNGPQVVTRRGKEAVVVLSIDEFRKFTAPTIVW